MHSKKFGRWLKLVSVTLGLTALAGTAFTLPSQAVTPAPTPYCADGTCWVTFDYTGDYSVWTPPAGINSLHFEVYGAQGGRSGGKGGSVTGDFAAIPSSLYVYVGGAGGSSNSAAGGFNGGGTSGNGHGDQGSGGGASDLRTSTQLSDRVVVAGGGGGTGGWIGGAGGPGGLTIASAGTKGATATTPGGGGTQLAGGTAGLGVTTGNGTAGSLGQGGVGGSGTIAGGGGGGGGFYGGGGGGSDNLAGGSDGAGGGGGSSFATMALTSNVSHQAGVRTGNGQVVIRYTFAPKVNSFTLISGLTSTTGTAVYQVVFDQYVYDVDPWDFAFAGTATGCAVNSVYGDGYTFTFQVLGCTSGTLRLSLRPWSVIGSSSGPAQETFASSTLTVDSVPAALTWANPSTPSNATALNFTISSQEAFELPTASSFELLGSGCRISNIAMTSATSAQVSVQNCASGANVRLVAKRNQFRDLAGNLSPSIDLPSGDVLVDYEAPSVASIASTNTADYLDYTVTFTEPVTGVNADSFQLAGAGCAISKFDGSGASYHVYVSGCTGQSSLTVKAMASLDLAGNAGPVADRTDSGGSADTLAPTATITELTRTDQTLSPSFELRFDELVNGLTINSLSRTGTAKNCSFTLVEQTSKRIYRIDSTNCAAGNLRLTLLADSVTDTHGNLGPLQNVDSPLVKISAASTSAIPAGFRPLPTQPGQALPTTPVVEAPATKQTKKTSQTTEAATASLDALKPDSWVSIAIALVALVIAKRPRGRRRA
ncbi:MAG: hypothetical protein RLZZ06_497 [Actinomycetota bacterium]